MAKFSLIQIYKESGEFIDGVWIQDHVGTLETAKKAASKTEIANGNKIKVAVVEKTNSSTPDYSLLKNLKRLG